MVWLQWILIFMLVWLILDVMIIVTIWGFTKTVKPRFPDWWRRNISDEAPSEDS